jgi:hypothetical protein
METKWCFQGLLKLPHRKKTTFLTVNVRVTMGRVRVTSEDKNTENVYK